MPACSGLEPDVEDVHLLAEVVAAAGGTGSSGGQQGSDMVRIPGVGAFLMEELDDALVDLFVIERRMALLAHEDGVGHAPDALPRDGPVRTRGDHVGDAFLSP